MTIKQAIEKAIEGGWNPHNWDDRDKDAVIEKWAYYSQIAFLDREFWQSLGKTMGWRKPKKIWSVSTWDRELYSLSGRWRNEMHNFIDHLAEGKDAESFFELVDN